MYLDGFLKKLARTLVVLTAVSWSLSLFANLQGVGATVSFSPAIKVTSLLFSPMFFSPRLDGTVNYRLTEVTAGDASVSWEKRFRVEVAQRDDGGYDLYRGLTPDGKIDGKTPLEGIFVRNDDDHTALLEYKDPEDGSWVRMEFANTRTSLPETEAEKENWRLKITTTITTEPDRGGWVILSVEDELKWFDIIAGGI